MLGFLRIGAVIFACALAAGCQLDNPGIDPEESKLNLPVALALSLPAEAGAAPEHLFVANSNFDVRYNAGSVQSFRLDGIHERLVACQDQNAGDDCEVAPEDVIESEVLIGSFASGLGLSPAGDRLYVPVRSDADLTFVDVQQGELSCGGDPGERHRCTDAFRRSDRRDEEDEDLHLPEEPIGVQVGSLAADFGAPTGSGDYVFLAHRGGSASLFTTAPVPSDAPILVDVLEGLTDDLAALGRDPDAQLFWLSSASSAVISRVGIALGDTTGDGTPSVLYDGGAITMAGLDFGRLGPDTRSVVFDPRGLPRAYVLMRRPEAIVVADLEASTETTIAANRVIQVGAGPSRLVAATFFEGSRVLLFVSCFDSRDLYVLDPDLGELLAVVRGMSGPFELVVDTAREAIYVADFRSSVVRVVTIAPLLRCLSSEDGCASPSTLGSLGTPRLVEELR